MCVSLHLHKPIDLWRRKLRFQRWKMHIPWIRTSQITFCMALKLSPSYFLTITELFDPGQNHCLWQEAIKWESSSNEAAKTEGPCHWGNGTIKTPPLSCSEAVSVEYSLLTNKSDVIIWERFSDGRSATDNPQSLISGQLTVKAWYTTDPFTGINIYLLVWSSTYPCMSEFGNKFNHISSVITLTQI